MLFLNHFTDKICDYFFNSKENSIFAHSIREIGTLTEWLGSGLQNRVRRFESARYLILKGIDFNGFYPFLHVWRGAPKKERPPIISAVSLFSCYAAG